MYMKAQENAMVLQGSQLAAFVLGVLIQIILSYVVHIPNHSPTLMVYGQHLTENLLFVLRSYGTIPGPRETGTTQLPILAKSIPLFSILRILFGT